MTTPIDAKTLRPTLVIGLGGTGYRIAVELKARLVETFGSQAAYDHVVKFLCLDTANENFTARQPNHPERDPVGLSRGREFVRISDVPLQALMQKRNQMLGEHDLEGIYEHLPITLRSSHIDQGAQQIRRLGRIALFHRYQDVKKKLRPKIHSLMHMGGNQSAGSVPITVQQQQRIRVYIVCSICGGTGSGTFIDIAYLTRYFAMLENLPAQNVDIVGMLLLPEAFPEIDTTGAERIRANACAALLDLEYYNQDTLNEDRLYRERFNVDRVSVPGKPFNICYLVGGSNREKRTVNGVRELAPMLAESIYLMISSRVGEQLDATLDNIKVVTTEYHQDGHRRLYSGLGIAELSYPRVWLQQRVMKRIQQQMIDAHVLHDDDNRRLAGAAAQTWLQERWREVEEFLKNPAAAESGREVSSDVILEPLNRLENTIDNVDDPLNRLRTAYRATEDNFRQMYLSWLRDQHAPQRNDLLDRLKNHLMHEINARLSMEGSANGGLLWASEWLSALYSDIYERSNEASRTAVTVNFDTYIERSVNRIREQRSFISLRQVAQRRSAVREDIPALRAVFEREAREEYVRESLEIIFSGLLTPITRLQQQLDDAVEEWQARRRVLATVSERPLRTVSTIDVLSPDALQAQIREVLNSLEDVDVVRRLRRDLNDLHPESDTTGIALTLTPHLRPAVFNVLERISQALFNEHASETVIDLLKATAASSEDERSMQKLLEDLETRAAPLLVYDDGQMSDAPPPEFRVLGLRSEKEELSVIQSHVGEVDTTPVSTGDPERVVLLHTQHGIPLSALQNYDVYYDHYLYFARQPNSLLHMSNQLERAPYNPASIYFYQRNELRMLFIRALAYQWITYESDVRTFVYNRSIREALQEALTVHIENLRLGRTPDESDGDRDERAYGRRMREDEIHYMETLRLYLDHAMMSPPAVPYLHMSNLNLTAEQLRQMTPGEISEWSRHVPTTPTLKRALASLVASPLQTLPGVFRKAFDAVYNDEFGGQSGSTLEQRRLREYLTRFGAQLADDIDSIREFDRNRFELITNNEEDVAIQRRLLLQLAAYELMEKRRDRLQSDVSYYWK